MISGKAPELVKKHLEKLKKVIEKHRYLYHVLDKQEISEEALDSLKNELVKIETQYPQLITADSPSQRVAGEPLKKFEKIKHKVSQWSFNDAFTEQDIKDFEEIKKAWKKIGGDKLTPVKRELGSGHSFEDIRLVKLLL